MILFAVQSLKKALSEGFLYGGIILTCVQRSVGAWIRDPVQNISDFIRSLRSSGVRSNLAYLHEEGDKFSICLEMGIIEGTKEGHNH